MATMQAVAPPITKRERSLNNAKALGGTFVVLGIANAIGGIVVGHQIRQITQDAYGNPATKIAPIGWAFIINAAAIALILALAGMTIIAFSNAMHPRALEPVFAPTAPKPQGQTAHEAWAGASNVPPGQDPRPVWKRD